MAMIQIFGTKKCRDTQKALRFFKDRGIEVQFRDIEDKAASPGELDDAARAVGGYAELLDLEGRAAADRGLKYMDYDAREELLRDALLLKTPLVRAGKGRASVGMNEKVWKEFAASDKP
jgi:arsenate reductase-like glutaredoxin family protein